MDGITIKSIYLAGGMEKAGPFGAIWRKDVTPHLERLGYSVWNPYEEELNVGVSVDMLVELKKSDYSKFVHFCKKIVDFDIAALRKCDAVAVRIDESVLKGAGTYGEITMCRAIGIPVYAWIDLPKGKYDVPAWAMGCITRHTESKEDFYKLLEDEYTSVCNGQRRAR